MFGEAQIVETVKASQAERYGVVGKSVSPPSGIWVEHAAAAKAAAKSAALAMAGTAEPSTTAIIGVDPVNRINAICRPARGTYGLAALPTAHHLDLGENLSAAAGSGGRIRSKMFPAMDFSVDLLELAADTFYAGLLNPDPGASLSSPVLDALLRLKDGWDGADSIAPPTMAKIAVANVFSHLSRFMGSAETEVDPTIGEVTFSWFFDEHSSSVTVTVLPSGRIVLIAARLGEPSKRQVFEPHEIARLGRAAVDFGLNRVDA